MFDPRYDLHWRGTRWTSEPHLSPVKGGIPQKDLQSKSALIPGRGASYLYVEFVVPVEIRENIPTLFCVTDGDGKEHAISVTSGWLNYEGRLCTRKDEKISTLG